MTSLTGRKIFALIAAVAAGVGLGSLVGLRMLGDPVTELGPQAVGPRMPNGDPAVLDLSELVFATSAAEGSHFAKTYGWDSIEVEVFSCTVFTPLPKEICSPPNPRLDIVPGERSYARSVLPYLEALGAIELDTRGSTPLATKIARALEAAWRGLQEHARGEIAVPPMRILVKRYPRPELPGRCVSMVATFYTAIDIYLDRSRVEEGGVLFEIRKTYQLQSPAPRLVEAGLELLTGFGRLGMNIPAGMLLGEKLVGQVGRDSTATAHFEQHAAAERIGLLWVDRSAGMEEPDPWSGAFRIAGSLETSAPLTPALKRALLEIAGRA